MEAISEERQHPRTTVVRWLAVFAAPMAWFIQLTAGYGLVELACRQRTMLPLLTATVCCVLFPLIGGIVSIRGWRGRNIACGPVEETSDQFRSFMGAIGLGFAVLFTVMIAGQTLAAVYLKPCP